MVFKLFNSWILFNKKILRGTWIYKTIKSTALLTFILSPNPIHLFTEKVIIKTRLWLTQIFESLYRWWLQVHVSLVLFAHYLTYLITLWNMSLTNLLKVSKYCNLFCMLSSNIIHFIAVILSVFKARYLWDPAFPICAHLVH